MAENGARQSFSHGRTGGQKGAGLSDASSTAHPREASAGRLPTGHEPWFLIDIPRPPSVNRFKGKLGNKSPCVVEWRARADRYLRAYLRYPRIVGEYEIIVTFSETKFGKYDAENFMKALSDWLQSREIVQNDRLARCLTVTWGYAPIGCRVAVRQWRHT